MSASAARCPVRRSLAPTWDEELCVRDVALADGAGAREFLLLQQVLAP